MDEPIDNIYFNWLCAKVVHVEVPTPSLTYWNLLRKLHDTEFIWLLSGDDNRVEDGLELRREFLALSHLEHDTFWDNLGCSVLEMLIAFARRLEFETDQPLDNWFWQMLQNLGVADLNDAMQLTSENIDEILHQFVWRTYRADGFGGLFPLRNPEHDQRKVEIWYQFCEYMIDDERD